MKEDQNQKELFEFEEPRKTFLRWPRIFRKPDFDGRIAATLSLDKIIFISIAILMLIVVVYAAGVERGRFITNAVHPVVQERGVPITAQAKLPDMPRFLSTTPVRGTKAAVAVLGSAPSATKPLKAAGAAPIKAATVAARPSASGKYIIVAITFSRRDTAAQEANRLKKEGLDAMVVESNSYFQVCVGSFIDKNSTAAINRLSKVRRFYKDAYFRQQ